MRRITFEVVVSGPVSVQPQHIVQRSAMLVTAVTQAEEARNA
jgi:hypothetical protein